MSALADMASESCGAVAGAGGVFGRARPEVASHQGNALPNCGCGGRPVYRECADGRFGRNMETLECGSCGNKVGPYPNRHQLAEAWRLGGWKREILIPEIVVEGMPWKCADCGHKWQDRKDGKGVGKRGCPACGSKRTFDCNVSLANFVRKTLNVER